MSGFDRRDPGWRAGPSSAAVAKMSPQEVAKRAFARLVLGGVLVGAMCVVHPPAAAAAARPPVEGSVRVVCAYGDAYSFAGQSHVHRGADVAAIAGQSITACIDGEVTFAGLVPSDSGGRVGAVTVRGDDGLLVTLMPLAELSVSRGSRVSAGDEAGTLAASGDASSEEAHVHVSVRRGSAYLDPASVEGLLVSAAAEPAVVDAPVADPAPAPAPVVSSPAAAIAVPASPRVTVPNSATSAEPAASEARPRMGTETSARGAQTIVEADAQATQGASAGAATLADTLWTGSASAIAAGAAAVSRRADVASTAATGQSVSATLRRLSRVRPSVHDLVASIAGRAGAVQKLAALFGVALLAGLALAAGVRRALRPVSDVALRGEVGAART